MPFLTGYGKRKEIRYGTTLPGANLTDFPKLFTIVADADIAAELSGGGGIAITEDDETTLVPFGLYPSSDPTSGDLLLRAKFPVLLTAASPGDVIGYIYYDAGETTTEDKAGVVDNGYVVFMPLEEDPSGSAPQMFDWVSETNVGTSAGSMTSGDLVAGQVANGLAFDGNDRISLSLSGITNIVTLECIVKGDSTADFGVAMGGTASNAYFIRNGANGQFGFWDSNNNNYGLSFSNAFDDTFRYLAGVADGSNITAYTDGVPGSPTSYSGNIGAFGDTLNELGIGALHAGGNPIVAIVDEVRISSVARDADWIEYAYEDDFNNADTFTLGTEEVDGGGGTFTGTSALTISNQTLAATATHEPEHTATSTLTVANQTLSASATHETPEFTGTAALTITNQVLAASAEHDTPIYTGTADLNISNQILVASGTTAPPGAHTGTSVLTISNQSLAASATFDAPIYTGTASLSITNQTLAASAEHDTPVFSGTSVLTVSNQTLAAVGSTLICIELTLQANDDDSEADDGTGLIQTDVTQGRREHGYRFSGSEVLDLVGISVFSSHLHLTSSANQNLIGDSTVRLVCEDVDAAAQFTDGEAYSAFNARPVTTAFADWTRSGGSIALDEVCTSPDLSGPVQEILDRLSLSVVHVLLKMNPDDAFRHWHRDGSVAKAATLEICYFPTAVPSHTATAALTISNQTLAAVATFSGVALEFRERLVIDVPDSRFILNTPAETRLVVDLEQ